MRFTKILILVNIFVAYNYASVSCELNKNKNIIIVGAGPSGIAAASKLFENGFTNITLLEAEKRIGGRVYTTKIGNYSVDLGGQWVYGQKDNVAFNMAYPLDLLDTPNASILDLVLTDSSGSAVQTDVNKKFLNFFDKYYIQGEVSEDNSSAKSFGEYIEEQFDKELGKEPEIMRNKMTYMHFLEVFALSSDPAESWYKLPISGDDGFKECEGDKHVNWKSRGYGTIVDILMKRYPDPTKELPILNNTILDSEVISIDYSNSENEHPVKVTVKDGKIYETDHVIVTVSLGVLKKQHTSLFIPGLPENKIKAIEGISFGGGGKVFLLFDKPFWQVNDRKGLYYGFLWNDAERKAIEQDPDQMWVLGFTGAEPVEHKPNLLELYISSKYASVMESVSEEKVFNESAKVLNKFLGKTYNVTDPIAMLRTQWHINPHFRGTYSYHSIETKKQKVFPEMLKEPIIPENPKILFAGEATSQHRFGTVDGAIESGWAAATRLINLYKTSST